MNKKVWIIIGILAFIMVFEVMYFYLNYTRTKSSEKSKAPLTTPSSVAETRLNRLIRQRSHEGRFPREQIKESTAGVLEDIIKQLQAKYQSQSKGASGSSYYVITADEIILELIKRIKSVEMSITTNTPDLYTSIADVLKDLGIKEMIPALIELLKNEEASVRAKAARCLAALDAQEAIPELLKLLEDKTGYVRASAIRSLGELGAQEAITAIIKLLNDTDTLVRMTGVIALGELGAKGSIPELVRLMKDTDNNVRRYTGEALAQLNAKEAIPELIKLLQDEDWRIRESAITPLAALNAKEAIPELIKLIYDENVFIYSCLLADALAQLGAQEAGPELVELLKNENESVRAAAAECLGKLGVKDVVSELIKLLQDKSDRVHDAAVEALGNLHASEAIPELIKLLKNDTGTNQCVMSALAQFSDDNKAITALIELLNDKERFIRGQALTHLYSEGIRNHLAVDKSVAPELIANLTKLLKDENTYVRELDIRFLGELGAKEAVPEIMKLLLQDKEISIRESAANTLVKLDARETIPELINLLNKEKWEMRELATETLVKFEAKESIPPLLELLNAKDKYVRGLAAVSLVELGAQNKVSQKAIEDIQSLLETDRPFSSRLIKRVYSVLEELGIRK